MPKFIHAQPIQSVGNKNNFQFIWPIWMRFASSSSIIYIAKLSDLWPVAEGRFNRDFNISEYFCQSGNWMNFETVGFKNKIFMKSASLKTKLLESIKNYEQ